MRVYKSALLAFLADNLASNDLGGFKKSFSFSFWCCCTSLATQDTMHNKHVSETYDKADKQNETEHFLQYLNMLDCPTSSHYFKTYRIN